MFIAGRDTWRITIDEPSALRVALYIRDVQRLDARTNPAIPPLDPGPDIWPVWSGRPRRPAPPLPTDAAGRRRAAEEWALWWAHLLPLADGGLGELAGDSLPALARLPALQPMVRHHRQTAMAWADGIGDDPRIKRDHLAFGSRLTTLVEELERMSGRPVPPFEFRITVIGVQTKHAWVLTRSHLLFTHRLVADDENALDWLRHRIGALV